MVVWVSTIEAHGSDADTMMASPGTIVWTTDTWLASDLIPPAARNLSPDQLDRTEPVGPAEIDLATVLDPGTGPPPEVLMLALLESLGQSRPGLEDLQREAMRVAIDLLDPKA